MADSDRIDVHHAKPGTKLVQESDRLPAGVLSPPCAHPDDPDAALSEFADVDDGFGLSAADVHTGEQRQDLWGRRSPEFLIARCLALSSQIILIRASWA